MPTSPFDPAKAEAFAGRMLSALNDGALCLMISIGHRTGLFDALRGAGAVTSKELAARAKLNERYVREWLGAMTTGGVVSLAQGGEGLGAMWGEEKTRDYLARAGFRSIETHSIPKDINNHWYVIRK